MDVMLWFLLGFCLLGLLVVGFVAYPYRGRNVPRAARLTEAVAAITEKVDPGESPPLGVLTTPEKARRMSRRFERAERAITRGLRVLTPSHASSSSRSGGRRRA